SHWLRMRIAPCRAADKTIRGALVIFYQRGAAPPQVEQLLAAEAAGMAGLFAAIVHPLALVDPQQRILWTNPSFAKSFGESTRTLRGVPLATLPNAPWDDSYFRHCLKVAIHKEEGVHRWLFQRMHQSSPQDWQVSAAHLRFGSIKAGCSLLSFEQVLVKTVKALTV
ncbi:MAG: hypothetical protein EOO40_00760, partial [Deltaproteobacteria bacterium]